jgi:hypothetical protein
VPGAAFSAASGSHRSPQPSARSTARARTRRSQPRAAWRAHACSRRRNLRRAAGTCDVRMRPLQYSLRAAPRGPRDGAELFVRRAAPRRQHTGIGAVCIGLAACAAPQATSRQPAKCRPRGAPEAGGAHATAARRSAGTPAARASASRRCRTASASSTPPAPPPTTTTCRAQQPRLHAAAAQAPAIGACRRRAAVLHTEHGAVCAQRAHRTIQGDQPLDRPFHALLCLAVTLQAAPPRPAPLLLRQVGRNTNNPEPNLLLITGAAAMTCGAAAARQGAHHASRGRPGRTVRPLSTFARRFSRPRKRSTKLRPRQAPDQQRHTGACPWRRLSALFPQRGRGAAGLPPTARLPRASSSHAVLQLGCSRLPSTLQQPHTPVAGLAAGAGPYPLRSS